MRPDAADSFIIGRTGAAQCFQRHRRRNIGCFHKQRRIVHHQCADRRHDLGAVDQRQPFFGGERHRE